MKPDAKRKRNWNVDEAVLRYGRTASRRDRRLTHRRERMKARLSLRALTH